MREPTALPVRGDAGVSPGCALGRMMLAPLGQAVRVAVVVGIVGLAMSKALPGDPPIGSRRGATATT